MKIIQDGRLGARTATLSLLAFAFAANGLCMEPTDNDRRRLVIYRAECAWNERMESEPVRVVDSLSDAWRRTHDIAYVDRSLEVMDGLSGAAKTNVAKRLVGAMPETHDRMADVREMAGVPLVERLCTDELQARIDAAGAAGGGEVRLEAGEYVTGSLQLRSGVTLRLERNAVLKGSRDYSKYSRAPGTAGSTVALLQACGATNVAIVGEGVIDGNGVAAPYRLADRKSVV